MHHLPKLFSGYHFARYSEKGILYHCLSRTDRNALLLRPDRRGKLREICYGVFSKALEKYPSLRLYDFAILSNHLHIILSAENTQEMSRFMRYVKAELTERWHKSHLGRSGSLWEKRPYTSTALPTPQSQRKCFAYILSHGVKEGLVNNPTDWPGPHAAQFWFKGKKPLKGRWFNGTAFAKAKHKKKGAYLDKEPFYQPTELVLTPIPGVVMDETFLNTLEEDIIAEGKKLRAGRPCLGIKKIFNAQDDESREPPAFPWLERRGTYVAWCSDCDERVRDYLERFFAFQRAYRIASKQWLHDKLETVVFPPNCFMPMKFVAT